MHRCQYQRPAQSLRLQPGREERQGRPLKGFLFYSSSEIYGDPAANAIPTPETYRGNVSCTGPRACYDESKRFGETLCVVYAKQEGLPITMARPFNNYGPGLKITDGRVLPDFAKDVLAGRDIVMLSDGSPKRTFCYATDAITGYYKVLVRGRAGEAYNIGIDKPEISMAELAQSHRRRGASACSAIRARSCAAKSQEARLPDRQSQSPLPASSTRRARNSTSIRASSWRKVSTGLSSGTITIGLRKPPNESLDHRNGLCGHRHRRLPCGRRATTSSASISIPRRSTLSMAATRLSMSPACRSC